jgi:predicted transcriptional regulator
VAIELDAEVRLLLLERVASYEQLEALLLLRLGTTQSFEVPEVAARLRIDEASVATAMEALAANGLLEKSAAPRASYRYAPADALTGGVVDRLARLYDEQRLDIIRQMSTNAIERLRSSAARTFADAFLLRGRKE